MLSTKQNEKYSVITIDEVQQKYSILNLNEEWFYIRSSQSSLHIFKKILSGHLLIMSHQIILNEELNVECFLNEVPIRTQISKITDIRQISELLQDLDTYQKPDEIEIGITKAIKSVEYIIGKLTDNEDTTMHNSQTLLSRLQFIICQLENLDASKTRRRYNILTLVLSLKAQLISSGCYRYLQSLDCL